MFIFEWQVRHAIITNVVNKFVVMMICVCVNKLMSSTLTYELCIICMCANERVIHLYLDKYVFTCMSQVKYKFAQIANIAR
jgi:hypothetical protein